MVYAGLCGGAFRAVAADLPGEQEWSRITIDVSSLAGRRATLAEVFALVEEQTRENIGYAVGQLPLGAEVTMGPAGSISLARLFEALSFQQGVRFELRDGRIAALPGSPAGTVAALDGAISRSRQISRRESEVILPSGDSARVVSLDQSSVAALAEAVAAISGQAKVSRERKARQISDAVRNAVLVAAKGSKDPAAVLASAKQLAAAAAGAAPEFVDAIAGAASFAPAVAKIRGGTAQVRAAAFAGSRAPSSAPAARAPDFARPSSTAPSDASQRLMTASIPAAPTAQEGAPSAPAAPAVAAEPAVAQAEVAVQSESSAVGSFSLMPPFADSALQLPSEPASGPATPAASDGVIRMEKFGVEGSVPKNSQIAVRERAAVSVDIVTSRDFSKFIATDVSDIVMRMPGFSTTTRGSFAVVRGLAERYNPILVDGIVLPSSDPERQTPELDLFPTRLVDAVVVSKVFEPRLPGNSSGGAVDLRTKPLPEARFGQFQFGLRADEGALKGEKFYTSPSGGNWDLLALGTKDRPGAPTGKDVDAKVAEFKSRLLTPKTPFAGHAADFPLGGRFSLVFEDRIDLGGEGRAFGYAVNLNYDSSAQSSAGRQLSIPQLFGLPTKITQPEPGTGVVFTGKDYLESEKEVRIGLLASLGYAFNAEHSLALSAFVSQIGNDSVTKTFNGFEGGGANLASVSQLWQAFDAGAFDPKVRYNLDDDRLTLSESLHYRERNLTNLKLAGLHNFTRGNGTKLEWAVARVSAYQEEPDFWVLPYSVNSPTSPALVSYSTAYGTPERTPTRYWRNVEEGTWAGRLDAELKFDLGLLQGVRLQSGAYGDLTDRSFQESSYFLSGSGAAFGKTFAALLTDIPRSVRNLGFGLLTPFAQADRKLAAGYTSLVIPLLAKRPWAEKLELMVGVRYEKYELVSSGRGTIGNATSDAFYQNIDVQSLIGGVLLGSSATGRDRIAAASVLIGPVDNRRIFQGLIDEGKTHPAFALTWSPIRRMNVRAAFSETVARPSFREVGPYYTRDEVNDEVQHGNVFLRTSPVRNLDFRVEYFFPRKDLVALSVFAKEIEQPIERAAVVVNLVSRSTVSWFNNPDTAKVKGAEVEVAKNLAFLGEIGSWFTLGGNGTWIEADVARNNEPSFAGAGKNRRLFDQPEWIANAYATFERPNGGFSTTLSWFAISDVLRTVGQATWSTYVASHDRLDLTLSQRLGRHWQVRLSAKNLADPLRKLIADREVTSEEIVLRTFKDGRSYSLTATYDF